MGYKARRVPPFKPHRQRLHLKDQKLQDIQPPWFESYRHRSTSAIMKFQHHLPSILAMCALLKGAHAWGNMAHETVAYIAQNFVTSDTKQFCQNILGDTSTSYLANAATWADSYRYTTAGSFSYPYHFIDANDSPLSGSCGVEYTRDCGTGGCVVSALLNYVSLLPISRGVQC